MGEKDFKELTLAELMLILEASLNKKPKEKHESDWNIEEINVVFECDDGRILDAEEFFSELAYAGVIL